MMFNIAEGEGNGVEVAGAGGRERAGVTVSPALRETTALRGHTGA